MIIGGSARVLFMIGRPVDKVRTPSLFNAWLAETGREAVMAPLDLGPESVAAFFAALRGWSNCAGCVVTYPHKQAALAAADRASAAAIGVGGANVVRRAADGTLAADNTDGGGYVAALRAAGVEPRGLTVLLVGAGAAATAIARALAEAGIARLAVAARRPARGAALLAALAADHPSLDVAAADDTVRPDILCNATPLGLASGDPPPWPLDGLAPGTLVSDIVPFETPWLAEARGRGFPVVGGRDMIEGQFRVLRAILLGDDAA